MNREIKCPKCGFSWTFHEFPGGRTTFGPEGEWCNSCRNLRAAVEHIQYLVTGENWALADQAADDVRRTWPHGYRRAGV